MKTAIVHEWLTTFGGTERLLVECLRLFPQADVFALTHSPQSFQNTELRDFNSPHYLPAKHPRCQQALPQTPAADAACHGFVGCEPLRPCDLALARRRSWNKNSRSPNTYLLYFYANALRLAHAGRLFEVARSDQSHPSLRRLGEADLLRHWDASASTRSNSLIANSQWTADHIREAWRRESQVIHPPVDIGRFTPSENRRGYYLLVSRLVPYKMGVEIVKALTLSVSHSSSPAKDPNFPTSAALQKKI